MRIRGFEKLRDDAVLPTRSTAKSAGYDFYVYEKVMIPSHSKIILPTYIKSYMQDDEFLAIFIRSSMAIKKGLKLTNQVGIIDSDYYNNPQNSGHIQIAVDNATDKDIVLEKGDRIAQGIFMKYFITDDDSQESTRMGGIGSTDIGKNC